MWANLAFGFLTQNSSWVHFYVLDFQTPTEMGIKEIKVKCPE